MQQFFDALKNFRATAPSGDRITEAQRIPVLHVGRHHPDWGIFSHV